MVKKVLLIGFFGHNNLGDDLLLSEALSKIPLDYEIYIKISANNKSRLNQYQSRPFKTISTKKELYQHRYDYLLYSGGGLFPSTHYGFRNFLSFFLLKLCCRRIVVNGCGIVPKPHSLFFKLFLKQLYYCSVRDDVSLKYVQTIRKDVINCGDLYWGNENHFKVNQDNKKCIVCLANPFGTKELETMHFRNRYELFLKNVSDMIKTIKSKGYSIDYLPFYEDSDKKLITDVQSYIQTKDPILERGIDYQLDSIDKLFSQYQLGFCMRFHSILLSVKNNLPIVAINYDYKSESLLSEANLSQCGVRFGVRKEQFFGKEIDLDVNKLHSSLDYVIVKSEEYCYKASMFYEKKHKSVLDSYAKIFNNNL